MTIEAVFYVCDEIAGLERAVQSARDAGVDSVMIWDTGSTDGTLMLAGRLADRLYTLRVPEEAVNFGELETIVTHLCRADWVLRLDGDETIEMEPGVTLKDLIDGYYGVWKMPRYRWSDLAKTQQLEIEAFPDFQYRFFRNDGLSRYVGPLHPHFKTDHPIGDASEVARMHHFCDPLHLSHPDRMAKRMRLYKRLAEESGKRPEGSPEGERLAGYTS